MFDSTVTIALWLVLVIGGGSLWLNAIARDEASGGARGDRGNSPGPRGGASQAGEDSSDTLRARLEVVVRDRQR